MFKKIMAICIIGAFSICTLHAQNQKDTVPSRTRPRTDSIPKTDTIKTDTTKKDITKKTAFLLNNQKVVRNIFENKIEKKEYLRIYAIKNKDRISIS